MTKYIKPPRAEDCEWMREATMLPADYARCPGARADGELLADCEDCARRMSPPPNPDRVLMMQPPEDVIWSVCAYKIEVGADFLAAAVNALPGLLDEVERLRADAARYRWLRGGPDVPSYSSRWPRWEVRYWGGRYWQTMFAEDLDEAIDAAMKEQEK